MDGGAIVWIEGMVSGCVFCCGRPRGSGPGRVASEGNGSCAGAGIIGAEAGAEAAEAAAADERW